MRVYWWLSLTLVMALMARIVVFVNKPPDLRGKDGFLYLNAARLLRGERVDSGFDYNVNAPRNETLGRVVYPLFLNLAFALARWSPTPIQVLKGMAARQPRILDPWHRQFFQTKENLRAVQLLQHGLGLMATSIAFLLLWWWTQNGWIAMLGSLFAVGWRPAWLYYELCILTEATAGFLMLLTIAFVTQASKSRWVSWWIFASLASSYLLALTRPNFLFLPALLALYFGWYLPKRYNRFAWLRAIVLASLPLVIAAGSYKTYQSISAYHFALTPDAFEDPVLRQSLREHLARNPNSHHAIHILIPTLMERWHVSWQEVGQRLGEEARKALRRRPDVFLSSVVGGVKEYFLYTGTSWGSLRFWAGWGLAFLNLLGLLALFQRKAPSSLRLALIITILNALVCSVVIGVNAEQGRYAFPTEQLLTIAAIWTLWSLWKGFGGKAYNACEEVSLVRKLFGKN